MTEFLVFDDSSHRVVTVNSPSDVIAVVETSPPLVVSEETGQELIVITSAGERGPQGPAGESGLDVPDLTLIFENGLV